MTTFTELVDLAAERLGGSVLFATDDFFASKDNLLLPGEAVFIEGKYTDRGKWMDGWESRRKRVPGHDHAIVRLGLPGIVRGFVVDTAHFKGNFPQACAIEGAAIDGHPDVEALRSEGIAWTPILTRHDLRGDSKNLFAVSSSHRFTHLRFHIYPDGGVARLRVHGEVLPDVRFLGRRGRPEVVDLAAAENGALVVACNDMFFGSRHNLVMPGRGVNMGDGWETKRSRGPGPDWVVLRLATEGVIERALVDTLHFKGNSPESAAIDVAVADDDPHGALDEAWQPLLPRMKLQPHTAHRFEAELTPRLATHARLRIWPDGGVSRLRLFGVASDRGRARAAMRAFGATADLARTLRACCASEAWVRAMLDAERTAPSTSFDDLRSRASNLWQKLAPEDWEEAFRAHPRIGEKKEEPTQFSSWSRGEQASVEEAPDATLAELRKANEAYEERFGRTYVVCATGKSVDEMLAIAKRRLGNAPDAELRAAAEEQRKITELRLEKWLNR